MPFWPMAQPVVLKLSVGTIYGVFPYLWKDHGPEGEQRRGVLDLVGQFSKRSLSTLATGFPFHKQRVY